MQKLQERGYENAWALQGGFQEWQNAGLPVETKRSFAITRRESSAIQCRARLRLRQERALAHNQRNCSAGLSHCRRKHREKEPRRNEYRGEWHADADELKQRSRKDCCVSEHLTNEGENHDHRMIPDINLASRVIRVILWTRLLSGRCLFDDEDQAGVVGSSDYFWTSKTETGVMSCLTGSRTILIRHRQLPWVILQALESEPEVKKQGAQGLFAIEIAAKRASRSQPEEQLRFMAKRLGS